MKTRINYETITINLGGKVRLEFENGVEYIIAPLTSLVEGVHEGSGGPIFYSSEQLGKNPEAWNEQPVVINHPYIDGKPVSAKDPAVPDTVKVGVLRNSTFENSKLKHEAKLEKKKLLDNHKQVHDDIMAGKIIEVSTGLFRDEDSTKGVFNEKSYESEAKGIEPDHLAILTNSKGACSIECGCGLLQFNERHPIVNQKSWMDIIRDLRDQVDKRFGYSAYIKDVFDSWFVYEYGGSLWKLGYKATDLGVSMSDESPLQVYYITQYKTAEGTIIGNSAGDFNEREVTMDRKAKVDKLIANCGCKENQREFLTKLSEEQFANFDLLLNANPAPAPAPTPAPAPVPEPKSKLTTEEFINNAPPEMRSILRNSLESHKAEINNLITIITNSPANKFPKEFLEKKSTQEDGLMELRGLASLAMHVNNSQEDPSNMPYLPPIYPGMAGGPAPTINTGNVTEQPLEFACAAPAA